MYKFFYNNIFFCVSVILAVGIVYLFSNNLNKKEVIAGLEAQIKDLEGTIETMTEEEQESRENQPEEAQKMVAINKQNTDAKTDKKSRAEFTEGLSGWSIDDLENLQSALLWPDSQEDIDKIGKVTSLKELDISMFKDGKEVNWNLEAISGLENLEKLSINGGTSELNTEPLRELKNVRKVVLEGTSFDLSFLSGMEALEELDTNRTGGIENLSMIAGLKNLKRLDIYYVNEANLCFLNDLEQLEEIEIASDNIYGFEGLENLRKVKHLKLQGSCRAEKVPYMDMVVLENMKGLETLTIGGIKTGNTKSLTELESLEWIKFVNTGIEDIEPLCKMPGIDYLGVYGNKSKVVERQGEQYDEIVRSVIISDEIPYDFDF